MTDPDVATDFRSPLDRWLWANRKSGRWLADKLKVHEATVSRIRAGNRTEASESLLEQIRKITGLKRL